MLLVKVFQNANNLSREGMHYCSTSVQFKMMFYIANNAFACIALFVKDFLALDFVT